jgi:hypothetical protein
MARLQWRHELAAVARIAFLLTAPVPPQPERMLSSRQPARLSPACCSSLRWSSTTDSSWRPGRRPGGGSRPPEHAKVSSRRNRTAWSVIGLSRQDAVAPYALASTGSTFPAPWSS